MSPLNPSVDDVNGEIRSTLQKNDSVGTAASRLDSSDHHHQHRLWSNTVSGASQSLNRDITGDVLQIISEFV